MRTKSGFRWIITIVLISVVASLVFTLASTEILGRAGHVMAFTILAVFIVLGIVFDIIGIAVAAAVQAPFHSMAARREPGAIESLRLLRNADKVTCVCNDVVGDVSGIISGTTAALIAAQLMDGFSVEGLLFPLLISGTVTGLTVGGKAVGKAYAFNSSTKIVLKVGKIMNFFSFKSRSK